MAEDYNLKFDINADGVVDAEEQFLALGKSIDKARQELDEMRDANEQGSVAFQQQKQELEQMESAFRDLNKEMKGVDATFEDVYGEVQPLTTALGEAEDRLYQLALAGDTTSKEYQELLEKVTRYRKVQIQTDQVVDASATTFSQKLGGALSGAAGGFSAVQGAMGIFGAESEALESTLLKVNSAMALSQGIEGLREGAKSFKALGLAAGNAFKGMKGAFLATGIGAFIVTLGVVVAYWDDISEAIGFGTDAIEDQEKAVKDLEKANRDNLNVMKETVENNRRWMERSNEVVVNEEKIKDLQAQGGDNLAEINRLTRENIKIELHNLQVRKESYFELLSTQEQLKLNQDIFRKQQELERTEVKKTRKVHRSHRRAVKKEMISELEFNRMIEDLRLEQLDDSTENEIERLNVKYDRIIEDVKRNEKLKEEQKTALIIEQEKIRELELQRIRHENMEIAKPMELRNAKEIETAKTELIIDEERIRNAEINRLALERREKAKENAAIIAQMSIDGLRLVSDVAQLFAGKSEKAARRAFNIKKAADIAEATMSGYKAVVSTFANAPGGVVLKGIQAGIAGGIAAAQIAKIASAKFKGGGDEGGDLGSDVPSGGDEGGAGGSAALSPSFNIVGDTGLSQLAQIQQQPMQAFVVSGDVTSAQSLDRNKIQNATI
tara:strand:+ start:991 stop:2994 length:2004 start_codon:yes stop_codon:yes gene_type:complete